MPNLNHTKPTKEQFHAYLGIQYSGLTNMFNKGRVQEYSETYYGVELPVEIILYIMGNYSTLKEEYGDIDHE